MNSTQSITGYASVHNGSLFYQVAGSGLPVLLIHAGIADYTMWDAQFNLFSQNFRVIRYDTRGFGKSSTESTEFSNRQDIIDMFDHLGVLNACIIGISRGGQIAIDFTLEHPERVSALVLVAAGLSGYDYHPDGREISSRENEMFTHMDELWEKKAYDELADLETHAWADGPSQPIGRAPSQIREYIRKIVRENYTRQDGETTPITLNPPAADRLGEISAPTLILVGEYDGVATREVADYLMKSIHGSRKVLFPATAHLIPMEQPVKFNGIVLNFLNEVLIHDHLPSTHS